MQLCNILDIQYPIFLAPMAGVSTPELAAIVSNEGGLGSLGLGASQTEQARAAILKTKQLTDRPFQVNFFCHQPEVYDADQAQAWLNYLSPYFSDYQQDAPKQLNKIYQSFIENDDLLEVVLDTHPKAVSFHFGLPTASQMQRLKQADIVTIASVTQLSEALLAEQAGIDILIAQGIEAGGHRGLFNANCDSGLSTIDLVLLLQHYVQLPIIAAGGIMTGQDISLYLELGAQGAQLGTAFVQCAESAANDSYREALFNESITQITDSISGRPARGLFNYWQELIDQPNRPEHAGYPYTYDLAKQLHAIASKQDNDDGFAAYWAGANVAEIRRLDAGPLMQTLIEEIQSK
ncbi:nitronate monooxygenase [Acinetobacter qingfengensis]|uniref:Nitronate monooxygenase n=1 Tax=Acinetobacter qingfengensis TaxID=1262585 RepID=A0A1E7RB02_9GAMM|nr:nitronate monooxygenase [Acinetobacter qingfengensis]KAA8734797.1 nitronate monooxygenase [Acinetobacter qingfengensis]OEY96425.1 2-nitropropane dioxygenase [Acinetobacter qingfengensis]